MGRSSRNFKTTSLLNSHFLRCWESWWIRRISHGISTASQSERLESASRLTSKEYGMQRKTKISSIEYSHDQLSLLLQFIYQLACFRGVTASTDLILVLPVLPAVRLALVGVFTPRFLTGVKFCSLLIAFYERSLFSLVDTFLMYVESSYLLFSWVKLMLRFSLSSIICSLDTFFVGLGVPFNRSCSKAYDHDILFSSFISKHLRIKSLDISETSRANVGLRL